MKSRLSTFCIIVACVIPGFTDSGPDRQLDSLNAAYKAALSKLTSPQFEERKRVLRGYQQRGYVDVLSHAVELDGLSALLAYARVKSQIAYSIPHHRLYLYIPVIQPPNREPHLPGFTGAPSPPIGIPLPDDWSFPADPWIVK